MTEYYTKTIKALRNGEFISLHCMLKDLEEESIWFDIEHAESEIRRALNE